MTTLLTLLSMDGAQWTTLIVVILVVIAAFLFLREVFLWYWKVNDLLKGQVAQNELLKKIEENTRK
jgi:hypothetical protein